jgi:hypothetical protein
MDVAPNETSSVVAWLTEEFGGRIDTGLIHGVATQEVALLEGSKVREFIPPVALRLARSRLEDFLRDTESREVANEG